MVSLCDTTTGWLTRRGLGHKLVWKAFDPPRMKRMAVYVQANILQAAWLLNMCSSKWLCGSLLVLKYVFKMEAASNKEYFEDEVELGVLRHIPSLLS